MYALQALKDLNLADNPLQSLPADLANLTSLKQLMVYGTKLTQIPLSLVRMPSLTGLWVEGCPLDPVSLSQVIQDIATSGSSKLKNLGLDTSQVRRCMDLSISCYQGYNCSAFGVKACHHDAACNRDAALHR